MALPRSQVVHVGLKVLDDAALVCGRQIRAGVRELHRADRVVVRLQDGLEVERQPVPERELAARGSCQNPSPLRRPLSKEGKPSIRRRLSRAATDHYDIDGASDFVGRCVHEFGAQRGGGVVWVRLGREEL